MLCCTFFCREKVVSASNLDPDTEPDPKTNWSGILLKVQYLGSIHNLRHKKIAIFLLYLPDPVDEAADELGPQVHRQPYIPEFFI